MSDDLIRRSAVLSLFDTHAESHDDCPCARLLGSQVCALPADPVDAELSRLRSEVERFMRIADGCRKDASEAGERGKIEERRRCIAVVRHEQDEHADDEKWQRSAFASCIDTILGGIMDGEEPRYAVVTDDEVRELRDRAEAAERERDEERSKRRAFEGSTVLLNDVVVSLRERASRLEAVARAARVYRAAQRVHAEIESRWGAAAAHDMVTDDLHKAYREAADMADSAEDALDAALSALLPGDLPGEEG